jgi:hypothetical protein
MRKADTRWRGRSTPEFARPAPHREDATGNSNEHDAGLFVPKLGKALRVVRESIALLAETVPRDEVGPAEPERQNCDEENRGAGKNGDFCASALGYDATSLLAGDPSSLARLATSRLAQPRS